MDIKYEFTKIEKKWQKRWEETNQFKTPEINEEDKKLYLLEMFPYPSGKLHMGHMRNYAIGDVLYYYYRMNGYKILHPMGWDAFGLPAENAAIEKGIHPEDWTMQNIEAVKEQLKSLGFAYDWDREINTSSPEYYKWTQWIFLQFYKKGLAYRAEAPINWCPKCATGLANEEVVNGLCERCGTEVGRKNLVQWMLRITKYADRLLDDLDLLKWPEKVKTMQANWIGRSEGAEIIFKVPKDENNFIDLPVFTTRADTLFGATYMVLAPEHPLVGEITKEEFKKEVDEYINEAIKHSELQRITAIKEKTGVFTGSYAINPANNKMIPIWISDYVLLSYGTGAIMAVPAHDERDFEFAKKFSLPIIEVIYSERGIRDKNGELKNVYTGEGTLINSDKFNGLYSEEAKEKIVEWLAKRKLARKSVNYKLRDWIFSRQRYWGEPIPIILCDRCGEVPVPEKDLPVLLPRVSSYKPTGTGESPLANIPEFYKVECPNCHSIARRETNTMPQWAGSSWYFIRFADPKNSTKFCGRDAANYWLPVDVYVGGIEHAVLHLLYARFFTKVLYDLKYIDFDEPFIKLYNQGMIYKDGAKMSKSKGNVVEVSDIVSKYGADTARLFILFAAPPEKDMEWSDQGVEGCFRFLNRLWNFVHSVADNIKEIKKIDKIETNSPYFNLLRVLHKTIKRITIDIEKRFHLNTPISALMELLNFLSLQVKEKKFKTENEKNIFYGILKECIEKTLILLSLYAPHICEELWEVIGNEGSILSQKWPKWRKEYVKDEKVEVVIQVNGKLRDKITVKPDLSKVEILKKALQSEKIKKHIRGKRIKDSYYVPGKILNIVTYED